MRESKFWTLHILSGGIILILLGIHMFIMHLDSLLGLLGIGYRDVLSFGSVLIRSKQLFHFIVYILLLGFALYHGLYGLRSMILELSMSERAEKVVSAVTTIMGVALFAYGTYVLVMMFTA